MDCSASGDRDRDRLAAKRIGGLCMLRQLDTNLWVLGFGLAYLWKRGGLEWD